MIEIYEDGVFIDQIKKVISALLRETLEGEFTFSFSVLAKTTLFLKINQIVKFNNQYFKIVQISKSLQGSLPICSVICEHISYTLNDDIYKINDFDFTGDPYEGLNQLLAGTPFIAGTAEYTENVTMKINQEVTRRAALMQFIAILGGEIEYDGYKINIRKHRGSIVYKSVMGSKNVTNVAASYDSRENASSYDISFFKLLNLEVGDNVHIIFNPLGLNVKTRITSLEYNPFYRYHVKVEVGNYKPSISDTFYRIESSMVNLEDSVVDVKEKVDTLEDKLVDILALNTETADITDAFIRNLTVNHLQTNGKDLVSDERNYIDIKDQDAKWITAKIKKDDLGNPLPKIQLTDIDGNLLYWLDETETIPVLEVTDYPIMVNQFDLYEKLKIAFENWEGTAVPVMTFGLGTDNDPTTKNGQGFIYKDTNGMNIEYYSSSGELRRIKLSDEGISVTPEVPGTVFYDFVGVLTKKNDTEITLNDVGVDVLNLHINVPYTAKTFQVSYECTLSANWKVFIDGVYTGKSYTSQSFTAFLKVPEGEHIITIKGIGSGNIPINSAELGVLL